MSQYITDYPRYLWQVLNGYRATMERSYAHRRQQDTAPYLDTTAPLRVLDLANGRLRPQYTLLQAEGHQVYGIDLVNRPALNWKDVAYRLARWLYTRKLGLPASASASTSASARRLPPLACGNVTTLPFQSNFFDLATSVAAFEHFLDVPGVVAELARVLRPGGVVWVRIHMFASISGGHNTSLVAIPVRRLPAGVEPWDHIRKRTRRFHVPLNEWRRDEYLETFARHFDLLTHYCHVREGEEMLTPAIEAELAGYSRDELTCRSYVIVGRKPMV
jgi:SAM-dependent methyltransferase